MNLDVTKCCLDANVNFIAFANFWSCRYYCNDFILLAIFFKSFGYDLVGHRQPQLESDSAVVFKCHFGFSPRKYNIRYIS